VLGPDEEVDDTPPLGQCQLGLAHRLSKASVCPSMDLETLTPICDTATPRTAETDAPT
jgi:hypothetical protein